MVLGGGLAGFYRDLCRPGWPEEVAALGADQGLSVYPFLFTAESRPVAQASRRPVPFAELLRAHAEAERQAGRLGPGSPVRVTITGNPERKDAQG
jgi:protein involved in polysaccharide export with SLBB domain